MKKLLTALLLVTISIPSFAQNSKKFSKQQLTEDLNYLKQQVYNVHVSPFNELSKDQYDKLFSNIESQLKDSLDAVQFLKLVKPVIAHLSDEHANISMQEKLKTESFQKENVYLPITLTKKGSNYFVADILSEQSGLKTGDIITKIDDQPIEKVIQQCASYTAGYPEQRLEKALSQFGYLYTWSIPAVQHSFLIGLAGNKTLTIQGVAHQAWDKEAEKQTGWDNCSEMISYQKFGDAGYINACSFSAGGKKLDSLKEKIKTIFQQVQNEKVKYLFVDVSHNSGGNSQVGDILIGYFYDKSYQTYQCDWKKSEEYLKLVKSWGGQPDDVYVNAPDGKVLHFNPDTIDASANPERFKGKVFLIVGNGTFSSAIMFATTVKDNHIAQLAGQIPSNGHPNHYGELYNTKLPNTQIDLRFGVKEWIRPSGEKRDNHLYPDITVDPSVDKAELVKEVIRLSKS